MRSPESVEKHSEPVLTATQKKTLEHWVRCSTSPQRLVLRSRIILLLHEGKGIKEITRELNTTPKTVRKWVLRWLEMREDLTRLEAYKLKPKIYSRHILEVLNDAPRSGAPARFTAEQVVQLIAVACEVLDDSEDAASSHWTHQELADEAVKRGIAKAISSATVGRFLNEAQIPVLSLSKQNHTRIAIGSIHR